VEPAEERDGCRERVIVHGERAKIDFGYRRPGADQERPLTGGVDRQARPCVAHGRVPLILALAPGVDAPDADGAEAAFCLHHCETRWSDAFRWTKEEHDLRGSPSCSF
jgi:hypothetical protein